MMGMMRKARGHVELKYRWLPNISREKAGGGQRSSASCQKNDGRRPNGGGRYLDGDERQLSEERRAAGGRYIDGDELST